MLGNSEKKNNINIIIPVYGVEKYVDEFMKSLCAQTVQDFTAIFVNDCCKDNSFSIIKQYESFFGDRMVIINNETNLGLSGSRNAGLDYSAEHPTEYISFLDPDDYIDPEYLEDLVDSAKKSNSDLCISGVIRFDDESENTICEEMINFPECIYENGYDCDEFAYINPCAYSKIYRFDAIRDVRFRDIKRSEDTCYLFEVLPFLHNIKFTNHAYYHYRVRNSSLSGALNREKYESMHIEFSKMLSIFSDEIYAPYKEMFETQIFIRSSIGGVSRLSFRDLSVSRRIAKEETEFLNKNVNGWKQNKYLTLSKKSINNFKRLSICVCSYLYRMHLFCLFVYLYYFLCNVIKKDVRA